jgi:apolipoprotein N-acyltransferase
MLAAVRAAELGIPVFRAGYTGISMVVEPHGNIYAETKPFTDETRVVTVRVATFDTFYKRFGDWFVALCALGLGLALALSPWKRAHQAG